MKCYGRGGDGVVLINAGRRGQVHGNILVFEGVATNTW